MSPTNILQSSLFMA